MARISRTHGQALRIVKSHESLYTRMVAKEYSRLFNVWRPVARRYFDDPEELNAITVELMQVHSAKMLEIYRTNNARVMRDVHAFQMRFLGITSKDALYSSTKSMIPALSSQQARVAVGETSSRTQTILETANAMIAEDDIPNNGVAYANERFVGGMGTRRAHTIASDQAHRAGNAMIQAIGDVGPRLIKRWMSRTDSKVRATHREANGQEVLPNETFTVGGESLRFPGDPNGSAGNVINCRCFSIVKQQRGKSRKRKAA